MKIIDVTLRDGGHSNNFDWGVEFSKEYCRHISSISQVSYLEIGYWKQTSKTSNFFYNLDSERVNQVLGENYDFKVSAMIDYHYCLKDLREYPKKDQNCLDLIRICSRKKDIDSALLFVDELKRETGLEVGFNIFNVSNYSKEELLEVCKKVCEHHVDIVYFADTHGSLDLNNDPSLFDISVPTLRNQGIEVGMHLHDHGGYAFSNFLLLDELGFSYCDASFYGAGKGAGNLKLEDVLGDKCSKSLIDFCKGNKRKFKNRNSKYTKVTSHYSIADHYALEAENMNMEIERFKEFCNMIKGVDKDVYNPLLWSLL